MAHPMPTSPDPASPSELIDVMIDEFDDWRGETLSVVRALIRKAAPGVVEEVKWRKPSNSMLGVPVWSLDGIICTGETYKAKVKLTFANGASLKDPAGLFNASLGGSTRRAIDLSEGDIVNGAAFIALVRAAVAANGCGAGPKAKGSGRKGPSPSNRRSPEPTDQPRLLAGGNPQIAKADGDSPVQAYIAAMPGWKRDVGLRLDQLIVRTVPNVRKAVRWNSPFYGIEGQGWFLNFHCFTRYINVAFFKGTSLRPAPPGESKSNHVRYVHIHEDDEFDEVQLASWVRQASELPGDPLF